MSAQQLNVTVPVYPFTGVTVIVDVAVPPAEIAAVAEAVRLKVASETVTWVLPEAVP